MANKFIRVAPSLTKNSESPAKWKILSNWKSLTTVRKYLTLKWIFDELTTEEYSFLVDTLNPSYDMFMIATKLFFELKSKRKVQEIFNKYYTSNNKDSYNIQVYKFLRSEARKSLKIESFLTRRRKGIKYSGWRRHQNDQGSLGPQVQKDFEYLIPQEEEGREQNMFLTLLSVSEFSPVEYTGLMCLKESETEYYLHQNVLVI